MSAGLNFTTIFAALSSVVAGATWGYTAAARRNRLDRKARTLTVDLTNVQAVDNEAIAKAIKEISKSQEAVLRIGNILLIKRGSDVSTQELTPAQSDFLERRGNLPSRPEELLASINAIEDMTISGRNGSSEDV